jgi:hypothetical protein
MIDEVRLRQNEIMNALGVVIGLTVVAVIALAAYPWPSRRVYRTLAAREDLRIEEILAQRFPHAEIDLLAAADLWRSLAECFSVSPGKLRLADRFTVELNNNRLLRMDDELSCVNVVLSKAASMRQVTVCFSKLLTIEDCIIALCSNSAENGDSGPISKAR